MPDTIEIEHTGLSGNVVSKSIYNKTNTLYKGGVMDSLMALVPLCNVLIERHKDESLTHEAREAYGIAVFGIGEIIKQLQESIK
jgi:hypothetical protein